MRRGETYQGAGPHEGHTITVNNVKRVGGVMNGGVDEEIVDVRCECGYKWSFDNLSPEAHAGDDDYDEAMERAWKDQPLGLYVPGSTVGPEPGEVHP